MAYRRGLGAKTAHEESPSPEDGLSPPTGNPTGRGTWRAYATVGYVVWPSLLAGSQERHLAVSVTVRFRILDEAYPPGALVSAEVAQ